MKTSAKTNHSAQFEGGERPVLPKRHVGELGFVVDEFGDRVSDRLKRDATALFCPPEEDTCRQEFKGDGDPSTILERFGAGQAFPSAPVVSGVVDYTAEFRELADAQVEARLAFDRIPMKYRRGYANWQEFLAGVERGEVEVPVSDPPVGGSGGGLPEPPAGAPSDSAAET